MYIASGQRQTAPRGQNFDASRNALSLYPFDAKFQRNFFEVGFIHFFHDLLHVHSPGAGCI